MQEGISEITSGKNGVLEKVLLDPIFMILKCDFSTHFGSCFLKLHDVSTSHLEALVT